VLRKLWIAWQLFDRLILTDDIYFVSRENGVPMDFSYTGAKEYIAGRAYIKLTQRDQNG
jgi:hypothetical protein